MSDSGEQQQKQGAGDSFGRTVAKKALAPVVATAATAATTYAVRKGTELWQEKLAPKLAERGGGMAVATETLEAVKEKLPVEAVKEKLPVDAVKEKLPLGDSSSADEPTEDPAREQERRKREQRRAQRRKSLEQARSS
jgi:hypothetical protein